MTKIASGNKQAEDIGKALGTIWGFENMIVASQAEMDRAKADPISKHIIKGTEKYPEQSFGVFFNFDDNGIGSACSLACVWWSVFQRTVNMYGKDVDEIIQHLGMLLPSIKDEVPSPIPDDKVVMSIGKWLIYLNDTKKWTQFEISDWLKRIGY